MIILFCGFALTTLAKTGNASAREGDIFDRLVLNGLKHKSESHTKRQLARPHVSSPVG